MAQPLLSDRLVDRLREVGATAQPELWTIERLTKTSDGAGGYTEGWNPIAVDLKARRDAFSGDESLLAGREQVTESYSLRLPPGTDVTGSDRMVHAGRVYEIAGVEDPTWHAYTTVHIVGYGTQ